MRLGDVAAYCPDTGDLIWLDFLQAAGNEQSGRRPALVLSLRAFNELTGRCIACPITRRDRDWSFHVPVPDGHEIGGVVRPVRSAVDLGIADYGEHTDWLTGAGAIFVSVSTTLPASGPERRDRLRASTSANRD